MNGVGRGKKASELIEDLRRMIEKHGDLEVFVGGGDYPDGYQSIQHIEEGDGYRASNSFSIG